MEPTLQMTPFTHKTVMSHAVAMASKASAPQFISIKKDISSELLTDKVCRLIIFS